VDHEEESKRLEEGSAVRVFNDMQVCMGPARAKTSD